MVGTAPGDILKDKQICLTIGAVNGMDDLYRAQINIIQYLGHCDMHSRGMDMSDKLQHYT